ncbi:uncharacterized MFS-type transporter YhjX-like [Bradysia coprophila]|uniref:uncharacterized MFS-type transporter YhjX-like n=1 Tax=Bradysia coprophila TaxID=38358 RepID=UPI00187DD501|nr:uncharacterized MFS-type transporter YhjX-like [Bradysia coprophila]
MEPSMSDTTRKRNPIIRAIVWHYSNRKCTIKPAQYEKEKYLISTIKFNPWLLMPAAVIVQFGCGSLYAWSVFNAPIDEAISGNSKTSQAPVTFYIAVGMFGIASVVMGPYLDRNGPRKTIMIGSSLLFIGNILSSIAVYLKYIWLLYLGFGVIAGFSIGCSYIAPISSLQKWFPHKRGLAGGVAVCGAGLGSIVIGKVILPLIHLVGLPPTFIVLGSYYFVTMMISAFLFRLPPPDYTVIESSDPSDTERKVTAVTAPLMPENPEVKLTLKESIKSIDFWFVSVMALTNSLFGLSFIARLADMVTKLYLREPNEASTIVSIYGALNLTGRIFFAALSDKIGRKTTCIIMLMIQTIIISAFPFFMENRNYWMFLGCMFVISMCYGGGIGIMPAFLTDLFGTHNFSVCYGIVIIAWSIAGTGGGIIFTTIYNHLIVSFGYTTGNAYPYIFNSYWILSLVVVGLLCTILIRTHLKYRVLPPVEGQWYRFVFFKHVVIVRRLLSCPEIEILSSYEYDQMWDNYLKSRHLDSRSGDAVELTTLIDSNK